MGRDLIMGPFTSFYLLKNSWRGTVVYFGFAWKPKIKKAVTRASLSLWSTGTGHTPKQMTSPEQRVSEGYSTPHCFPRHPWTHGQRKEAEEKKRFVLGWQKQLSLTLFELRSPSITGLLHNLTKGSIPVYFQGLKGKPPWNWFELCAKKMPQTI